MKHHPRIKNPPMGAMDIDDLDYIPCLSCIDERNVIILSMLLA